MKARGVALLSEDRTRLLSLRAAAPATWMACSEYFAVTDKYGLGDDRGKRERFIQHELQIEQQIMRRT